MKFTFIIDTEKINQPIKIVREINKVSFEKEILLLSQKNLDVGITKEEKARIIPFKKITYPQSMIKAIQEATGDRLVICNPAIYPRSEDFLKIVSAYLARNSGIFIVFSKPKSLQDKAKKILFSILYESYILTPFCDYLFLSKNLAEKLTLSTSLPVFEMAVKLIKRGYKIQKINLDTSPLKKEDKVDFFQSVYYLLKLRFYD